MSDWFSEIVAIIRNSPLFDAAWYSREHADVVILGMEPAEHYLRFGARLGRNPSPKFDTAYYLSANPDVAEAGLNPLLHYEFSGRSEGRTARAAESWSAPTSADPAGPRESSAKSIRCAGAGEGMPDLFALRAAPSSARRALVAEVRAAADIERAGVILHCMDEPVDLIAFTTDGVLRDQAPDLPGRGGRRALIHYPRRLNAGQALLHLVNSGPLCDYRSICWIAAPGAAACDAERAARVWRRFDREPIGIAAARFDRLGESDAALARASIGKWFARLGRKPPRDAPETPAGSPIFIASLILQQLRAYGIGVDELAGAGDALLPALLSSVCEEAGLSTAGFEDGAPEASELRPVRPIAFYLPQYHPIPENDLWWGKGFTEWTNVVKARPLFRSHYQPQLPSDLGFYDLRSVEAQEAQAALAREYGVYGFCYYYYWFDGKKLLNRPIERMLDTGKPDFPFCVCWANENWSRNWDGQNRHVLLAQSYSLDSNRGLIREFIRLMKDPRYIRHEGKPVLLVYRIRIIPDWLETAAMWREECRQAGVGEIHLCAVRFGLEPLDGDPSEFGVDAFALFPPHESEKVDARGEVLDLAPDFNGTIFSYDQVVDGDLKRFEGGYPWPVHRGAMLGWDNTARRPKDSRIFIGASPARFRKWLRGVIEQEDRHNAKAESLIFINAWNEWAEGTTLEPSQKFGRGYLDAVRSALIDRRPRVEAAPAKRETPPPVRQWVAGMRARRREAPTVLLCAHCVSHQIFGGERSFLDILAALDRLDLNIVIALPSAAHGYYTDLCRAKSVGVVVIPFDQWRAGREPDEAIVALFAETIAEMRVDLLYVNTIVLLEPLVAAGRAGIKRVVHARELVDRDPGIVDQIGLAPEAIVDRVVDMSDAIVANSAATADLFSRSAAVFTAPNVVDLDGLDMPNEVGGAVNIVIASSNLPKKGVADFLEVARLCEATAPNARFLVIGPENGHVEKWKSEGHPANVAFAGYSKSPREAMSRGNIVVNFSHFAESFGRTIAEAHAARRPVVAYRWGAVPELIEDGVSGFLTPYRDVEAAAERITALCADPALIVKMGEAGRQRVERNNSPRSLADNLHRALESVLQRTIDLRPADRFVTIVVPVFNAHDETKACLDALRRTVDFTRARVLMIDDGSSDERIRPLLQSFSRVAGFHLLVNEKNLGYTRTINKGCKWAGDDDIILLNSDALTTSGWFDGLLEAARGDARIGTVTAMSDNAGAFSFPEMNRPNPKPESVSHEAHVAAILRRTAGLALVEVPTGSGFCMYIRRALIDEIGLFDEEAFPRGYGEENDFCMRGLKAGWRHVIAPQAYVFHTRSASFGAEKEKLIKGAVETVMRRHPDYVPMVKAAFASPEMLALRRAAGGTNV